MYLDLGPLGPQTPLSALLVALGITTILYGVYNVASFLLSTLVLPGTSLSKFRGPSSTPTYAVITGASDGIGKEYALQLARKGFSLILVSRTQKKLDDLKTLIQGEGKGKIRVETLSVDVSKATETDYVHLTNLLEGKRVGVLVNNVGQSHSIPVEFAETETRELEDIVKINCLATLRVTQTVLPYMLPHRTGLILTMGSFAGLTPTPFLAVYSGSKSFLQAWNTALASELEPKGIQCHLVQSYLVTSAMSKVRRANWLVPSEKNFVRTALGKIGNRGGSFGFAYAGSPYWSHALVAFVVTAIFGPANKALLGYNKKMHVDVRRRALRKAERDAKSR